MSLGKQLYGSGLKYPLKVSNGKLETAEGLDSIKTAIKFLLSTPLGSRYMLPEFGSNLYKLLFDPLDQTTLNLCRVYTEEAIARWISRVQISNVNTVADKDNRIIKIVIQYELVGMNKQDSLVYSLELETR